MRRELRRPVRSVGGGNQIWAERKSTSVNEMWLGNQSRQKWRPKQSAGEVARVDKERRLGSNSSSETTSLISSVQSN